MSIIDELSSSVGVKTQEPNSAVAERCLADPDLLREIEAGLALKNTRLAGDCAEVMTKVAERRPDLVAPHAATLRALLGNKNGRVRWEAAHALSLVASLVPETIAEALDQLRAIVEQDKSVIVRDYIIDAVAGYGASGPEAAGRAFPILSDATSAWEEKHAARALRGLVPLVALAPRLAGEAERLAQEFEGHARAGVQKAARALLRAMGDRRGRARP